MRPASFEYCRPRSVAEALNVLRQGGVPLAGGQSLIQAMRLRQAEPEVVVDLADVADLGSDIAMDETALRIGARVTQAQLAAHPAVRAEFPWLAEAALRIGDVQVRNRGTVLGNVCWADPCANMAVALLASDAVVHTVGPGPDDRSRLALTDFFRGFRSNGLDGRLATGIEVPRPAGWTRGHYLEFSRQPQDLALCNVCVVLGEDGTTRRARVAVGGLHVTALRLRALEDKLERDGWKDADPEREIARAFADLDLQPCDTLFAAPDYQIHLGTVMVGRALNACREERHVS